ncbi:MAG: sensor histidine kinase [Methylococcaceae bacterium]|nr:sensor histidine kinase [Methylococcaceae bacterium]
MDLPAYSRKLWLKAALAALAIVPLSAWLTLQLVQRRATEELRSATAARLDLYAVNFQAAMDKHGELPVALSHDKEVGHLLADPGNISLSRHLGAKFKQLATATGALNLSLMDASGVVVASSDYDQPGTFLGQPAGPHHLYTAPLTEGIKRYFAVDAASRSPAYFIAYPVGAGKGILEVKVSTEELERTWQFSPEILLVTDRQRVVYLANVPQWHFWSIDPLPEEIHQELVEQQPYGDSRRPSVPILGRSGDLWTIRDAEAKPRSYLAQSKPLGDSHWTLWMLSDLTSQHYRTENVAMLAALAGASLVVLFTLLIQRRSATRIRLQREQRWNAELERQVRSRTAELEQAAKLAALGQMAAGVAHEINQPLSAIRAFADNGRRFIELGQSPQADANLVEIIDQADRLRIIADQLKAFVRRPSESLAKVDLIDVLGRSLRLFSETIRHGQIAVHGVTNPEPLGVYAEQVRLQQILVNLISNALDAVRDSPTPAIAFDVATRNGSTELAIRDAGPGIAESELEKVFEPFYSLKPAGKGLGLGLPISRSIAVDFGGSLCARNHPEGGAVFILTLKTAD